MIVQDMFKMSDKIFETYIIEFVDLPYEKVFIPREIDTNCT